MAYEGHVSFDQTRPYDSFRSIKADVKSHCVFEVNDGQYCAIHDRNKSF